MISVALPVPRCWEGHSQELCPEFICSALGFGPHSGTAHLYFLGDSSFITRPFRSDFWIFCLHNSTVLIIPLLDFLLCVSPWLSVVHNFNLVNSSVSCLLYIRRVGYLSPLFPLGRFRCIPSNSTLARKPITQSNWPQMIYGKGRSRSHFRSLLLIVRLQAVLNTHAMKSMRHHRSRSLYEEWFVTYSYRSDK